MRPSTSAFAFSSDTLGEHPAATAPTRPSASPTANRRATLLTMIPLLRRRREGRRARPLHISRVGESGRRRPAPPCYLLAQVGVMMAEVNLTDLALRPLERGGVEIVGPIRRPARPFAFRRPLQAAHRARPGNDALRRPRRYRQSTPPTSVRAPDKARSSEARSACPTLMVSGSALAMASPFRRG